ncbi:MAG: Hsp33 family molecular chaperone HslO, partial [Deltaproteobacteria bacterium]
KSEQVPSAMGLGVFVDRDGSVSAAGGFLVQTLFSAEDRLIDQLIQNIQKIPFITEFLRQGKTPEEMVGEVFSGIPCHGLEKRGLRYQCTCSRRRVERALIALGREELERLAEEEEITDVTCEYCRSSYAFTMNEIDALLREIAPES